MKEKQTFTETTLGGKTVYQGEAGKFDYTYIKGDGVIILTAGSKKQAEELIAAAAVGLRRRLGYDRSVTRDPNRPVREAWIVEAVRTPIGRYGGALASVRPGRPRGARPAGGRRPRRRSTRRSSRT